MSDLPSIDWKGDSAVLAAVLAGLGLLRRVLAPYARREVQDAMSPVLNQMLDELKEIRLEQGNARDARTDIVERLAHVEGIMERRRLARG